MSVCRLKPRPRLEGDRCCSGCALAQPVGSFACLRPYSKVVGGGRYGAARRLAELPAAQAREWTVPTAAGHRLGSRVGPAFQACAWSNLNPAWPGTGLGTKAPLPLGLSQDHEDAAAVSAARVKVTSRDCSGPLRQVMSPAEVAPKLPEAWRLCTRGMV